MAINLYSSVPNFLPGLIGLLILLLIIFVIFSIVGVFFKKRSTVSAIMFFLAISSVLYFLSGIETENGTLLVDIALLGADYGIGAGLVSAITALGTPVALIHSLFVSMLAAIMGVATNDPSLSFVGGGLFAMIVWVVLFVVAFILFNRKKKSKRVYSDYLS